MNESFVRGHDPQPDGSWWSVTLSRNVDLLNSEFHALPIRSNGHFEASSGTNGGARFQRTTHSCPAAPLHLAVGTWQQQLKVCQLDNQGSRAQETEEQQPKVGEMLCGDGRERETREEATC
ncbi:hypothetical protein HRR83_001249 [Exophiala dermatitidis]|nr:hypothetical protein HRR74_001253 [Exophiala dermatitidis]KAJ4599638.1 hypothetical protein HRR84_003389 [Exophiala dermatitidis]KAJ4605287.1 hypothetical protein HRR83_001249 [Exophiala dermatitidis]KAJ4645010.1 hypothetical protein HRR89_002579 [Exophiala dermatitidis]KAJ4658088.1 hypothetical protein HRR91_001868 [Exophiala dermatitidis]